MKTKDFVEMFSKGFLRRVKRLEDRNRFLEQENVAQAALIRAHRLEKPDHIYKHEAWLFSQATPHSDIMAHNISVRDRRMEKALNGLGFFKRTTK